MNPSTFSASFLTNNNSYQSRRKVNSTCFMDYSDFVFVVHPESGRLEGKESERIFYFNSSHGETLERKTQMTGFAEAVVNFTENFTEEKEELEFPYRYVNTGKQLHVYILLESGKFILGCGINKEISIDSDFILRGSAIKAVLITAYKMFRLFFGSFSRLIVSDVVHLKDRLEYFFSRYLPQLHLHRMPLLDIFSSVSYLSVDSLNYLRIGSLLDDLMEAFPIISKTMFFYQEHLVTSTVSKSDLPILYRYLSQNLLCRWLKQELRPDGHTSRESTHRGHFLMSLMTSTANLSFSSHYDANAKLPVVYLCDDINQEKLVPYEMCPILSYQLHRKIYRNQIVYRALNATICMFIEKNMENGLLQRLDDYLGPDLSALASLIADSYGTLDGSVKKNEDYYFIYYNPETMSIKTNFVDNSDCNTNLPSIPSSIYKSVCDMFDEFMEKEDFGEATTKFDSDWWIVMKKVNKRFLLLVLRSSTISTGAEMQQWASNIMKNNFDTIFLY
ncbi:unnamed protein product [Thelazia callipaeda]|uniref:Vacuolar fusion protein MON1 homolog n=1 Tax=Thelazia callipaeda TaxID=103827 RepID=A0A0N5DAR2_THECL|nr:unnamed protein product [Thelazia callipaeda]